MKIPAFKLLATAMSVAFFVPVALAFFPGEEPPTDTPPPSTPSVYNRTFYSLFDLEGNWGYDSDTKRGNSIFFPAGESDLTAVLVEANGRTTRATVPAGGCLLETPHFLLVSEVCYDLRSIGDSGTSTRNCGLLTPTVYASGQWRTATKTGCAGQLQWNASANCYQSTCASSGNSCGVDVETTAGGIVPHTGTSCDGTSLAYEVCAGALEAHF